MEAVDDGSPGLLEHVRRVWSPSFGLGIRKVKTDRRSPLGSQALGGESPEPIVDVGTGTRGVDE